jgi:glycosyltransferase involved in cell wall biosynthesis
MLELGGPPDAVRTGVAIGIPVHADPERLRATLTSLRAHAAGAAVVLLPDGPDAEMRAALAGPDLSRLPQLGTDEPRGAPACWNRLIAWAHADVVVLLESGAVLGPGALEALTAALAQPGVGLAGPSTNLAWNEQAAFRGAAEGEAAIAATARAARARFGDAVRSLTPLHSLADFCFAARREAIEAVGAADEDYALGPCWEMDYSIRAARAGFAGVWACAAYVHRAPFPARRLAEEARWFEPNKRRYQDKFCGRRLRGVSGGYEAHCKGDGCADFAPPGLIRIGVPLAVVAGSAAAGNASTGGAATGNAAMGSAATGSAATGNDWPSGIADATAGVMIGAPFSPGIGPLPGRVQQPTIAAGDRPMVSCIMPTRDRAGWVPQAIRYFLRQDFSDAELVIVDDGESAVRDLVPDHPRIRYFRVSGCRTVGAKRNLACAEARGELIAHWDDDDWYPASRLRRQVEALRAARAELCGTTQMYFYQPAGDQAWRYEYAARGAPMLVGTSLVYRRQLWQRTPFADLQVGEDVRFVRGAACTIHDLADPALCVATIHAGNTSPRHPDAVHWRPQPAADLHRLLGDDLAFYRGAAAPLVSCIMPTADRRAFVPLGVRGFLAQDWPHRELVIVDDGRDPIGDLVAGLPGVRYLRLAQRASIGAKRNLACAEARGELIAHWDDDDWYAPSRLSVQAAPIVAGCADITGLENRFILQLPAGEFWTTRRELRQRMFAGDVIGGTMMYRRALFTGGLRYPEASIAEDAAFLREAVRRGHRLAQLDNPGLFVYVRHGRNTWQFEPGRFLDPRGWEVVAPPPGLPGETLDAYRRAAAARMIAP